MKFAFSSKFQNEVPTRRNLIDDLKTAKTESETEFSFQGNSRRILKPRRTIKGAFKVISNQNLPSVNDAASATENAFKKRAQGDRVGEEKFQAEINNSCEDHS